MFKTLFVHMLCNVQHASQVHIYEHCTKVLDESIPLSLKYPHYICHGAMQELPMRWFECNAVQHERIIIMQVVSGRDGAATAVWFGNTWSYRGGLIQAGTQGVHVLSEYLLFTLPIQQCCFPT